MAITRTSNKIVPIITTSRVTASVAISNEHEDRGDEQHGQEHLNEESARDVGVGGLVGVHDADVAWEHGRDETSGNHGTHELGNDEEDATDWIKCASEDETESNLSWHSSVTDLVSILTAESAKTHSWVEETISHAVQSPDNNSVGETPAQSNDDDSLSAQRTAVGHISVGRQDTSLIDSHLLNGKREPEEEDGADELRHDSQTVRLHAAGRTVGACLRGRWCGVDCTVTLLVKGKLELCHFAGAQQMDFCYLLVVLLMG
jgi:hypothetical protein